jgi:uncharacterized protein (DUF2267 family)
MKFFDQDDFAAHVAAHLGATTFDVRRACTAVLDAFAGWLSPAELGLFARELPGAFEHPNDSRAIPIEEQLVELGLTFGQAREVIASVGRVLGEHLSDDMLARLQHALPMSVATFTVRPGLGAIVTRSRVRRYDTLAEGRPGSHAPVSEAPPAARVQQASVAADNPHGDIKLSSAFGSTQEREHATLAEGHPEAHPIATAHE